MKKVEKFRLTKEQVGHMREMQKLNAVKEMLTKGALQKWYQEGNVLKKLFGQLQEKQQMLMAQAPEEKTNEIPGQTGNDGQELFTPDEDMGAGGMEAGGQQAPLMEQNQEVVR